MAQKENHQKQCPLLRKEIGFPELINVFYKALMIFLVFTAANNLVKGLINGFRIELLLYIILWISMVIQTTFAYKHITDVFYNYKLLAFLSDCLDICIFIYVCAAIGNTYSEGKFVDMASYWHISIPFLVLSFNQLCWYDFVKEKKKAAAVLRLILLFVVMLTTTILDIKYHNIWILVTIVGGNFLIMVILRAINWAPKSFRKQIDEWSKKHKRKHKKN